MLAVCRAFPVLFVTPQLRLLFDHPWFSAGLMAAMLLSFALALVNLALRPSRILGLAAIGLTLVAGLISQFGGKQRLLLP